MLTALMIMWLTAAPLYPLNPVKEDTANFMNLHFTIGLNGPNRISSAGPVLSAKYEILIHHPIILRVAFDYRYGKMQSRLYPKGAFHSTVYSFDCLYYRGTNHLTGYLGPGILFNKNYLRPDRNVADSLASIENISNIGMSERLGYRFTFGLRFRRIYSLEIIITDVRPNLVTSSRLAGDVIMVERERIRLQDVRVMVGYLLPVKL